MYPLRHKHVLEVKPVNVLLNSVLSIILASVCKIEYSWLVGEVCFVTNGNGINRIVSAVVSGRLDNHQERKCVFQQIFSVIKNLRRERSNVIYSQNSFLCRIFFSKFPLRHQLFSAHPSSSLCFWSASHTFSPTPLCCVILMSFLNTNKRSVLFITQNRKSWEGKECLLYVILADQSCLSGSKYEIIMK